MGSWYEACGLTSLPIEEGTPVRGMFINPMENPLYLYPFSVYAPASFLVKGTYNDYGWMEFYPGELARLQESAKTLEINFDPEDGSEITDGFYFWMIREDSYQLLDKFQIDYGGGIDTVAKRMAERRQIMLDSIEKLKQKIKDDGRPIFISEDLRTSLGAQSEYGWTFYNNLRSDLYFEENTDIAIPVWADDLFDLLRIWEGFLAVNKSVVPTVHSSSCNEEAHRMIGKHITKIANDLSHRYDEEELIGPWETK